MAHYEPLHQDLHCLQIQIFSSLLKGNNLLFSRVYLLDIIVQKWRGGGGGGQEVLKVGLSVKRRVYGKMPYN